jgi:hypothetical protein
MISIFKCTSSTRNTARGYFVACGIVWLSLISGCTTSSVVQTTSPTESGKASEGVERALPGQEKALEAEIDSEPRSETIVGYYAWWMKGHWIEMDLSLNDRIIFFTTTPGTDGHLQARNGWPHAWVNFLRKTDSLGVPVVPALALLEPDSIKALFSNPESIQNLLDTSLELIEESGGTGVHLDIELFESVPDSLRDLFIGFTDSLAIQAERRWPDVKLSLFAPAFDYDGGLYDLSRIHAGYSQIMVQGYDLHWQTGPKAGPVSTLSGWGGSNWKDIVARYQKAGIESARMIMTIPYYGYEWPVESNEPGTATRGEARIVTFAETDSLTLPNYRISVQNRVAEFGMSRDSVSGSPYYAFSDSTGWWQGWYEDETSLEHKYQFIRDAKLKGIATFPMGYDKGILDAHWNTFFGRRKR